MLRGSRPLRTSVFLTVSGNFSPRSSKRDAALPVDGQGAEVPGQQRRGPVSTSKEPTNTKREIGGVREALAVEAQALLALQARGRPPA